ncbi:MAG: tetratricopeptide repeat protein, partial [Gammaproteobacteria bacterium]|nr:tetratricopeptide repeat protein [Gammaproteobacteria bacterium]
SDEIGLYALSAANAFKKVFNNWVSGFQSLFAIDADTRYQYFASKGILYAKRCKYRKAINMLEMIQAEKKLEIEPQIYLAVSYIKTNRAEDGYKLLESLSTKHPGNERILSILSTAYIQDNKYNEALPILEKLIDIDPDNIKHNMRLAKVYESLENFDKVISILTNVIKIDENNAKAHHAKGFAHEQIGEKDTALEHYKIAMDLEEKSTTE